jgi:hypothetical protein
MGKPSSYSAASDRSGDRLWAAGSALEAALFYRSRGWSVLPTLGKKPHPKALNGAGWGQLRVAPADEQTIAEWYRVAPDAGVAVLTGMASGVVVCDIEREGLEACPVEILEAPTPQATTPGGGRHVYFAADEALSTQHCHVWGDLQADGAYVVAPSGLHDRQWLSPPDAIALARWDDYAHLLQRQNGHTAPTTEAISTLGVIGRESRDLLQWDADPTFVDAFSKLLGITAAIGEKFNCLLPSHEPDKTPSANLWPDPRTGRVLYRCWQEGQTYALAQVYAAVVSGEPPQRFKGATLAMWKLRLLLDADLVAPPHVEIPALADNAPEHARLAYPGLRRLFQARALSSWGLACAITPRFFASWCRITPHEAREARHYFRTHGTIVRTGERLGRADLYVPGSIPQECMP